MKTPISIATIAAVVASSPAQSAIDLNNISTHLWVSTQSPAVPCQSVFVGPVRPGYSPPTCNGMAIGTLIPNPSMKPGQHATGVYFGPGYWSIGLNGEVPLRETPKDDSNQSIEIVSDAYIDWGTGGFFSPPGRGSALSNPYSHEFRSFLLRTVSAKERQMRALELLDACETPLPIGSLNKVTSGWSSYDRWLAAQAMFNNLKSSGLVGSYLDAYKIDLIVDAKHYRGVKVKYSDGASEVWLATPNNATSSVKLFDTPAPDSLTAPTRTPCNAYTGHSPAGWGAGGGYR